MRDGNKSKVKVFYMNRGHDVYLQNTVTKLLALYNQYTPIMTVGKVDALLNVHCSSPS